jgi:DHA1 family inner membrane transport protein
MTTSPIPLPDRGSDTPTGSLPIVTGPVTSSPPTGARFPWVGLIALSAAVFLSVTSEMIPTGLLPDMSASLGVTESQVGFLVSAFAFTVVLTSAPLTALTVRIPRKTLIMSVLVLLAVANVLTALAPTYPLVLLTRVLGGIGHGLFWSMVGAYAAHLVPKELIGRAVSITLAGGTLAFVLGVPLGTAAGHAVGWRLSFVGIAVLLLVGAVVVYKFLPPVERELDAHADDSAADARASGTSAAGGRSGARRPVDPTVFSVALVCITVAIVMIGHYSFYTYIAPYLTDVIGVPEAQISLALFGFGITGALGLVLAGTVFAKRTTRGLLICIGLSIVFVTALALVAGWFWAALIIFLVWGIAYGAIAPLMQTRMLHSASARIRDTASAFYTTAFNVGIGGGAFVGGLLLDGIGIESLPYFYVVLLVIGGVLVVVARRYELAVRRRSGVTPTR